MNKKSKKFIDSMSEFELEQELDYLKQRILSEQDEEIVKYITKKLDSWWRRERIR